MTDTATNATTIPATYKSPRLSKAQYVMLITLAGGNGSRYTHFSPYRLTEEHVYESSTDNTRSVGRLSTRSIPQLLDKGFVRTEEVESQRRFDRRYTVVKVTDFGRRHLDDAAAHAEPAYVQAQKEIDDAARDVAYKSARDPVRDRYQSTVWAIDSLEKNLMDEIRAENYSVPPRWSELTGAIRNLRAKRAILEDELNALHRRFYPEKYVDVE